MVKKETLVSDKLLKKLEKSDKLISILKNLMWLKSEMKWEGILSKYRIEELDKSLQKTIDLITTELLSEMKEKIT